MPRYKIFDQRGLNYLTLTTVGWIDLFSRKAYKDIIIESLQFCQQNKGLVIYGYVIMTNHIHLICQINQDSEHELSAVIRDFKKYTAKKFIHYLENGIESRKKWILKLFREFGKKNTANRNYQIWTNNNHPIDLYSPKVIWQKLDYIHFNPVKAGIVINPEDYVYSSARNYSGHKGGIVLNIDLLEPFLDVGFKFYPGK